MALGCPRQRECRRWEDAEEEDHDHGTYERQDLPQLGPRRVEERDIDSYSDPVDQHIAHPSTPSRNVDLMQFIEKGVGSGNSRRPLKSFGLG